MTNKTEFKRKKMGFFCPEKVVPAYIELLNRYEIYYAIGGDYDGFTYFDIFATSESDLRFIEGIAVLIKCETLKIYCMAYDSLFKSMRIAGF